jgi:hypothetical protein
MALAHMQMLVHALDTRAMASTVKSSRSMYGSIFLITSGGMFSLSYVISESRKPVGSASILVELSQ